MNYVISTSTDSRFYGNLPKTQIDLNRSMGAKASLEKSQKSLENKGQYFGSFHASL